MLKRLLKKGVKALNDVVKNKIEIIEAKKEIVKEFITNDTLRTRLGDFIIALSIGGLYFGTMLKRR